MRDPLSMKRCVYMTHETRKLSILPTTFSSASSITLGMKRAAIAPKGAVRDYDQAEKDLTALAFFESSGDPK